MSQPSKNALSQEWNKVIIQQLKHLTHASQDDIQITVAPKATPKLSLFFDRAHARPAPTPQLPLRTPLPTPDRMKQTKLVCVDLDEEDQPKTDGSKKNMIKLSVGKGSKVEVGKGELGKEVGKQQADREKRMRQQEQIIEQMNVPRWVTEKNQRRELNSLKYPLSSTTTYDYTTPPPLPKGYSEKSWILYERNKLQEQQKAKERQEKEREKRKEEEKELKRKLEKQREQEIKDLFSGLMGLPHKKVKETALQKQEILEHINAEDQEQPADDRQDESRQEGQEGRQEGERRQNRIGIKDIVKAYQSSAPHFVQVVLKHNFGRSWERPEEKRIPDSFEEQSTYKKVFHYLITNECIADLAHRLKQLPAATPLAVTLTNCRSLPTALTELALRPTHPDPTHSLRALSLSRYRLAVLTSQDPFRLETWGVQGGRKQFAFMVVLVTPETKEDLGGEVRCHSAVKESDLEWALRERGNRNLFLFDLDKLTTHVRQYLAVSNLPYSQLAPTILEPRLLDKQVPQFVDQRDLLTPTLDKLATVFNPTQWESIREMALRERGLVLLQGPPGTGKTSTLMGLLAAQFAYLQCSRDSRKIMVCAPSNAAVDHIVRRLLEEGLMSHEGTVRPSILRVGIVEGADEAVRSVSLDELCERVMLASREEAKEERQLTTPQIKEKMLQLQKEMRLSPDRREQLQLQLTRYEQLLFAFRREKVVTSRRSYAQVEAHLLDQAQIILTTLSSSANDKLDRIRGEVACLIVDEAAQATEPALLVALQSGVEKVLLIGDPCQLPATCLSPDSNVTLFNRSLFERFLDAGIRPYFLDTQYRMAPLIRAFPSRRFYHDRLMDAPAVQRELPGCLMGFSGRNVVFLDVGFGREGRQGESVSNEEEARVVGVLVRSLFEEGVSLGVITPYQAQRRLILRDCQRQLREKEQLRAQVEAQVMVNTVDSFQGQEKDIIIMSTVRANPRAQVGFLSDERRINVALTRAKFLLVVVGHGDTLAANEVWADLLDQLHQRAAYYQATTPRDLQRVLEDMFSRPNPNQVVRITHQRLSSDQRKAHRSEIQSVDFSSHHKQRPTQPNPTTNQEGNKGKKEGEEAQGERQRQVEKGWVAGSESELMLQSKRKQEREAEDFVDMQNRMRKLEEDMRKGDDEFMRQMFQ